MIGAAMDPATLKITDAHVHFFGHSFFKALLAQRPGGAAAGDGEVAPALEGLGLEPPPSEPEAMARRWLGEMDRHWVRQAALIASLPSDWPAVSRALRVRLDRFAGYAMVNPRSPDAEAVADRLLGSEGFRGLCLFPAMHRFRVHDPEAL